jgi:hypothetical protein
MTFTSKITPYKTYTIDLTSDRVDEALSVVGIANSLTVMAAPSAFSMKLNSVDNEAMDAIKGFKMDGISVTEIFITNSAGSGDGQIFLAWVG